MNAPIHTPMRSSPVEAQLKKRYGEQGGVWQEWYGMPVLAEGTGTSPWNDETSHEENPLAVVDVSCLPQWGVKGAGAMHWLEQQGILTPEQPNCWCSCPGGGLVARLGMTEFAVQLGWDAPRRGMAMPCPYEEGSRVYPVERQYMAIALFGSALPDLLRQTCNVNFQALVLEEQPVVMTMMVGVGVTVLPWERDGIPFYQVWGDRSYGAYLWQTLVGIAEELGGGVVGSEEVSERVRG